MEEFQDELSLEGMTYQQAQDYVGAYLRTFHKLEKDYEAKLKEVLTWEKRKELSQQRGDAELLEAAERQVKNLRAEAVRLRAEKVSLEAKVEILKTNLKTVSASAPLTNAKALLQQFENMLGPDAALEGRFQREKKDSEVEDELAALKAKMKKKD